MPSPLDGQEVDIPTQDPVESTSEGRAGPPQPLAIDYNAEKASAQPDPEPVQSLDLGEGNVVKLDQLGPMIVNSDGTLSRITNWNELSPGEQERTVRLLVKKRNLIRLKKMEAQEGANGQAEGEQLSALQGEKA